MSQTWTAGAAVLLAAVLALAGCSGGTSAPADSAKDRATEATGSADAGEPSAEPAEETGGETAEETASGEDTEPAATTSSPAPDSADLFPAEADLIGAEVWFRTPPEEAVVVDGEPLPGLADVFGACFDATADEACPFAIAGLQPAGADGSAVPSTTGMLLLLELTGRSVDGSAIWAVLDARVVVLGTEALLESCVGDERVAIVPAGISGSTVVASAAWGSDAGHTAIVDVDPATLACEAMGG